MLSKTTLIFNIRKTSKAIKFQRRGNYNMCWCSLRFTIIRWQCDESSGHTNTTKRFQLDMLEQAKLTAKQNIKQA